jgi:RNA polymerase sigma factor (sigma-70 family)
MASLPLDVASQVSLVERLRAGDPAAEHELVVMFGRRIRIVLEFRLRDREAARDLAQETLVAAITALRDGKLRDAERLSAFVHGVARNLANNAIRRRSGEPQPSELRHDMLIGDSEQEMIDRSQRQLASRALASLQRDDREVLKLSLVDGLRPGEIAARLRLGVDVVRTRKSRALKRISAEVQRLSRTGGENH